MANVQRFVSPFDLVGGVFGADILPATERVIGVIDFTELMPSSFLVGAIFNYGAGTAVGNKQGVIIFRWGDTATTFDGVNNTYDRMVVSMPSGVGPFQSFRRKAVLSRYVQVSVFNDLTSGPSILSSSILRYTKILEENA